LPRAGNLLLSDDDRIGRRMTDTDQTETDPFAWFHRWMAEAEVSEPSDPNAMTVVTVGPDGKPSARTVLLKGVDPRGFVFYTNTHSQKGHELTDNPLISLLFYWKSLGRQIRIEGSVEAVTAAESDAYYATRARISRLGAWASDQSRPLSDRAELERRLREFEVKYPGEDIPRPPHWSGYRVLPDRFEFWQNMPFRLHDRTIFERASGTGWVRGKLFP
jgi:pyridoxamine 5'-phosphate oxidase